MEKNFADKISARLDPEFAWIGLGEAIRNCLQRLAEDPAMGEVLCSLAYTPRQFSIVDTPRQ
eukprot:4386904-Pyramimonas_sp.AAC.1